MSASAALKAKGLEAWYQAWNDPAGARNDIAHGSWYTRKLSHPLEQLVPRVRSDALRSMAELRNAGVVALKGRSKS